MPISSFYGLQTSLRGLLAHQRSIDVTAHNIANASTVGYSRQEATLAAARALDVPAGGLQAGYGAQLGSGVDVLSYRRVRDTFLDLQYRGQATKLGEQTARSSALEGAELALSEPSDDGIGTQLAKFWNAWSDLANAPESPAARQALVSRAGALASSFGTVDGQLAAVAAQAAGEYASLTGPKGEVATIGEELRGLNDAIKRFKTAGAEPNDLYDRRDGLLDRLAQLGQVSIADGAEAGSIVVTFGNAAQPLVKDTEPVNWPQVVTAPGGRLGALQSLGGEIAGYRASLSGVARGVADAVNSVHTTGAAGGAGAFFTFTPGAEASTIAVRADVLADPRRVATTTGGAAGANDLALRIAALRGGPTDGAYQAFVTRVGTDVAEAERSHSNATVLTQAVDDRRQSVSGVAMDEEMTNLVRFQRAYQASARAMSTMDEMLDVLINRTGRVGL